MNLDTSLEALQKGLPVGSVNVGQFMVEDKDLPGYSLRRKAGSAGAAQAVWYVCIVSAPGVAPTYFYDYSPTKAVNKALDWKQGKPA